MAAPLCSATDALKSDGTPNCPFLNVPTENHHAYGGMILLGVGLTHIGKSRP